MWLFLGQEVHLWNTFCFFDAGLDHYVTLVVNDTFQLFGREAKDVADLVGQAFEEPDVYHRHHEANVPHALTTHLLFGYFNAAAVTYDAFVAYAFVLAAVAFVVLYRTENALTEEAITLRFIGTVVDGLRLEHFAVAALKDFVWACECNNNRLETLIGLITLLFERHIVSVQYFKKCSLKRYCEVFGFTG